MEFSHNPELNAFRKEVSESKQVQPAPTLLAQQAKKTIADMPDEDFIKLMGNLDKPLF